MSAEPCEVWFYQLERSSLDTVLPELLEKTLARGWRALVRTPSKEALERLDRWLWIYRDDSFLAHGTVDEPTAAHQPILLSTSAENHNAAQALFLVEGARCDDLIGFSRCVVIFDGREETALADGRDAWSVFKKAGHQVAYWRQNETRGWRRQA